MGSWQQPLISFFAVTWFTIIQCSRYALRIGSATIPLVKIIRFILYPVAKPLAWCLDVSLGAELATTYSSAEMMKLLQIHVQQNVIDQETAGAMTGALTYKNITVKEVMTPMQRTFMINVDDKLSFETIAKIFKTGYSRIPVFEVSRVSLVNKYERFGMVCFWPLTLWFLPQDNIIGLLFVKDLIFIDPEDEVPIRSFVQIFGRGVHVVWPDDTLGDVLAELKKGRTHLAVVRDVNNADESQDPFYEVRGIITLEGKIYLRKSKYVVEIRISPQDYLLLDIIEKIIGDNIVDETDEYVDSAGDVKVNRGEGFEWARLRLLDTKIVDQLLSSSEVKAVTAHFRMNYSKTVALLTDTQLERLVSTTPVMTLETAKQEIGEGLPKELLYEKGTASDTCTLILGGKVTVLVGAENFRSDLSSWAVMGISALERSDFCPDFSAFVSDGPCRCLRLTHASFVAAVDASAIERTSIEGKLLQKRTSLRSINDNISAGGGDTLSTTSSLEVPNRREKLLARLLKQESIENPIVDELTSDVKDGLTGQAENGHPESQKKSPGDQSTDHEKQIKDDL